MLTTPESTSEESVFTFTLCFPAGQIAVVQVHGVVDQEEAQAAAADGFRKCHYSVTPGDATSGTAEPFYLYLASKRSDDHSYVAARKATRRVQRADVRIIIPRNLN